MHLCYIYVHFIRSSRLPLHRILIPQQSSVNEMIESLFESKKLNIRSLIRFFSEPNAPRQWLNVSLEIPPPGVFTVDRDLNCW